MQDETKLLNKFVVLFFFLTRSIYLSYAYIIVMSCNYVLTIPPHCCLFFVGVSHGKLGTHHYFLSWREPWHKFEDWDWFNGRNFCRERCMDLVSFETPLEFQMFAEVMQQGKKQTSTTCSILAPSPAYSNRRIARL